MKPRRAIHPVAIEQRERRIAELRRAIDERLGQGRPIEKRKRGRGAKLYVHHTCRSAMVNRT
jgi:hypothetical protein